MTCAAERQHDRTAPNGLARSESVHQLRKQQDRLGARYPDLIAIKGEDKPAQIAGRPRVDAHDDFSHVAPAINHKGRVASEKRRPTNRGNPRFVSFAYIRPLNDCAVGQGFGVGAPFHSSAPEARHVECEPGKPLVSGYRRVNHRHPNDRAVGFKIYVIGEQGDQCVGSVTECDKLHTPKPFGFRKTLVNISGSGVNACASRTPSQPASPRPPKTQGEQSPSVAGLNTAADGDHPSTT